MKLNHSPSHMRTLDCETRASALGMYPGEQNYRSENIGAEMALRQYSHMLLPGPSPALTPKSHQKSSTNTKSAPGSQNASSTSQRAHNRGNDEPVMIDLVKEGKDLRTYLHVKNIPCCYSKKQLKEEVNRCHKGRYWTIEPIPDKKHDSEKTTTNKGYFFIGFKHPLFVVDFYEQY